MAWKPAFLCLLLALGPLASLPASAAPAAAQERSPESRKFDRLAGDYWETLMRLYPLWATFVNHPRYHDRLDDNGPGGRKAEEREMKAVLKRLEAIDREKLDESERVSWAIMKLQAENRLEAQRHKFWQWDVDHMDGPQAWIPSVVELAQPMKSAEDAQALLRRLRAIPGYFRNLIGNLRAGVAEGRLAARMPVEKTISQLDELLKTPAAATPYAAAGKKLPPQLQEEFLPKIVSAVEESIYPAYRDYLAFLKDEYFPLSREDKVGLSALPGGQEAYRFKIRYHTTLPFTTQELHRIGIEELEGIHAEMMSIARRMGHKGDLPSFLEKVRKDPKNFFTTREEVLRTAEVLVASAAAKLPAFFGILPKTPMVVKPVEDYREKNETAARYYPPPDDLARPGIYYINTYDPPTRARFTMTSLAVHEGVPGHHLQIAIAVEQRGLPTFRRQEGFTSFVEGWALYSERLADEMGLYRDDLSRLGMLTDQAWRAGRLVVDTGLHSMGWSRQKAIDFMAANSGQPEALVATEVDRYIIWPGQALAYKVGQREIMAIRKESQARLGKDFDIRAFHDAVLKNGAVPLPVLRESILGPASAVPAPL